MAAPVATWAWWEPLVFSVLCLGTGVFLHAFAFPSLERNLYALSKRLHGYPVLVLVIEESIAHSILPSMRRCVLLACIYGKGFAGLFVVLPCLNTQ